MPESLIHPKEKQYFWICAVISAIIYVALIVSLIGIAYILLFALLGFLVHGLLIGHLKGNAVKVGPRQFPNLDALVNKLAADLSLPSVPAVYILQSGGMLNAFATRFLRRNFVVLYSDIVELAQGQGDDALAFIVGHELGHLKMGHLTKHPWLYPALLMPFLGTAYYRACEYSADRCAQHVSKQGSPAGLLVLAAGKHLYHDMNAEDFMAQADESGFFVWLSEKMSTHPNLSKRVKELSAH